MWLAEIRLKDGCIDLRGNNIRHDIRHAIGHVEGGKCGDLPAT